MPTETEVLLISMPFGPLLSPSIGLGLLKSVLARTGVTAKTLHFQLDFARVIGFEAYTNVYGGAYTEDLAGEWVFSDSLFGSRPQSDAKRYIDEVLRRQGSDVPCYYEYKEGALERLIDAIVGARSEAESFLDKCLDTVLGLRPRVVGFTSMFHQHVASLALAKRVKSRLPGAFVIFGGPNCEGEMGKETLRQFEFVDAVVSGEGDLVFPKIVRRVLNSEPLLSLKGVLCRGGSTLPVLQQPVVNTLTVEDLDALPVPDYDEYFEQLEESGLSLPRRPSLLFETSRGCWWGEKHHCTFCGLNGSTMAYRSKTAPRAYRELVELTDKYPGCSVNVVDNILDMKYFKDFIPLLAAREQKFSLFYEVKANLKKEQLVLLRQAGITSIQPGVESFSDHVLKLMRKGVSGLQNVQLLKWCKELGLDVYYHLLWGFPGESADDYAEVVCMLPLISHLRPPLGTAALRLDRFSPNFDQAEQLGFYDLAPNASYGYVYPFGPEALFNLAYFFTSRRGIPENAVEYVAPLIAEVERWKECHGRSDLFWMDKGEQLLVWDFRPVAATPLSVLTGAQKFAYMACDQVRTVRQVVEMWRECSNAPVTGADIRDGLDAMVSQGLMLRQGDAYLALAYRAPGGA